MPSLSSKHAAPHLLLIDGGGGFGSRAWLPVEGASGMSAVTAEQIGMAPKKIPNRAETWSDTTQYAIPSFRFVGSCDDFQAGP